MKDAMKAYIIFSSTQLCRIDLRIMITLRLKARNMRQQ
jgi:hypothetical protein